MWIHQQPDWPQLHWRHESLTDQLSAVRYRQGRLHGALEAMGFDLLQEANLESLTEDVVTTSAIEGENLDRDDVRSSLARRLGIERAALSPKDRNVEGIVDVMLDATQRFDERLTVERLHNWHGALFPTGRSGLHEIAVAQWRRADKEPMQVVSGGMGHETVHFEAPPANRVDDEMKRFLQFFNTDDAADPVLKAGLAHLWFVTIHPYEDGNGRIARAIADMAMCRGDKSSQRFYSVSAQLRDERKDYYRELERQQRSDCDVTRWMTWFVGLTSRAVERAQLTIGSVQERAKFWLRANALGLNDRQRKVANRMLEDFDGGMKTSRYARLTKCSQDTALRDILDLVEKGLMRPSSAGGRSRSYTLVAG